MLFERFVPMLGAGRHMETLIAARLQMAISLGFHILFAVAGMAMPLFMVTAEIVYRRTGNSAYRDLAQRWAKGTAILFAVGAVSGTVLSFELGLLWPHFMQHAGPLIGMPFSLEGFAFFLEAIALGIYLYGWNRVRPAIHVASGVVVALSGLLSGIFVVAVNAWMNTPRGFRIDEHGELVDVDLWRAFFTPAFPTQAAHMAIAAYTSVAFAVLGIHAWGLRKNRDSAFHLAAIRIVLPIAIVMAPLQAVSGDFAAKQLAREQPSKLAAAESLFHTERGASLLIGGIPDVEAESAQFGIRVPKLLSVLATGDPNGEVQGLDRVPRREWPPVALVHPAFEVMVAAGTALIGMAIWGAWLLFRRRPMSEQGGFLRVATFAAPLGLIALEAGWMVTELGRQPWIIRGVMLTKDAVTPMPNVVVTFVISLLLYVGLGSVVLMMLARYVAGGEAR